MTVDRRLWQSPFYHDSVPAWPCPTCGVGTLELDRQWLFLRPSADSRKKMELENSDVEDEHGAVGCVVRCNRHDCGEVCSVAGYYYTEMRFFDEGESPVAVCWPQMITPAPPMIHVADKCPENIQGEICAAFRVFWCDKPACLNHVRQAIELLLTTMRVPCTRTVNGTRRRRSLHQRIEWLKNRRPRLSDLCDRLMAVKHLGNAGSHPSVEIDDQDVFDGFDILEHVLIQLYERTDSDLAKMVKEINKRKGPRKSGA